METYIVSDNPIVFLDISIRNCKVGRVVIELFKDVAPKTVANFRALCSGEYTNKITQKRLHYKGTKFHKVIAHCFAQGGNMLNNDGTGDETIYDTPQQSETPTLIHDGEGALGMLCNGSGTISSQFYITTLPCPHLDGTNVVFGRVRKGLNIVCEMADIPRKNDVPLEDIIISNCGEFKKGELWNKIESDGTEDVYPAWPNDWDVENFEDKPKIEKAITKIKESGNYYFNKQNYEYSHRKYVKTLRYIDWYPIVCKNYNMPFFKEMKIKSLLNLAAVKLKKKLPREALDLCNQVNEIDSNNGKAYFRRALARIALRDLDEALSDLNIAFRLLPNDKSIQAILNSTKKDKISYLRKEQKFWSKSLK